MKKHTKMRTGQEVRYACESQACYKLSKYSVTPIGVKTQ